MSVDRFGEFVKFIILIAITSSVIQNDRQSLKIIRIFNMSRSLKFRVMPQ